MAREVIRCYPEYVEADKEAKMIYALAYPRRITNMIELIKNRKKIIPLTNESGAGFVFYVLAGWI